MQCLDGAISLRVVGHPHVPEILSVDEVDTCDHSVLFKEGTERLLGNVRSEITDEDRFQINS